MLWSRKTEQQGHPEGGVGVDKHFRRNSWEGQKMKALEEEIREDMPTLTKDSECEQGSEGVRGELCRHPRRQFHSLERFRGTEEWG